MVLRANYHGKTNFGYWYCIAVMTDGRDHARVDEADQGREAEVEVVVDGITTAVGAEAEGGIATVLLKDLEAEAEDPRVVGTPTSRMEAAVAEIMEAVVEAVEEEMANRSTTKVDIVEMT